MLRFHVCYALLYQGWFVALSLGTPRNTLRSYEFHELELAITMSRLLNGCSALSFLALHELLHGVVSDALAFGEMSSETATTILTPAIPD